MIEKICTRCLVKLPIEHFPLCRGKRRARCSACHVLDNVEYAKRNRDKVYRAHLAWKDRKFPDRKRFTPVPRDVQKAKRRATRDRWIARNPDKNLAAKIKWAKNNPHKTAEICRRRQARKRGAIPIWANAKMMASFYAEARRMTKETGIKHEVDHIVPLTSDIVCGLHWEGNMRVITQKANRSKSNHFIEV